MSDTQRTIDFIYPAEWPCTKNPLMAGLKEQTQDWAHEIGLILSQDTGLKRMQEALDPAEFVGLAYPLTRNVEFLRFATDFSLCITVLDDELEKSPLEMDSRARTELLRGFKTLMEGGDAPGLRRYAAAYHDIISRLQRLAGEEHGPRLTARFISMFEQMLSMIVWEEPKASLSWQDRDYYEVVRPVVSQLLWYCMFVQIADECYLPETINEDTRVQRLGSLMTLLFSLLNDVMSISKDEAGQPVLNAVLMHMHRKRCSEAEAIAAVARWHNQRIGEFMQTAREAVQRFGVLNDHVERYARGVQNLLQGSIEWMLRVRRYTLPTSCQVRIGSKLEAHAPG